MIKTLLFVVMFNANGDVVKEQPIASVVNGTVCSLMANDLTDHNAEKETMVAFYCEQVTNT